MVKTGTKYSSRATEDVPCPSPVKSRASLVGGWWAWRRLWLGRSWLQRLWSLLGPELPLAPRASATGCHSPPGIPPAWSLSHRVPDWVESRHETSLLNGSVLWKNPAITRVMQLTALGAKGARECQDQVRKPARRTRLAQGFILLLLLMCVV